jgi:hypothetical protein
MALFARPHFLQPVELRDHRRPLTMNERPQQPVQLYQALADVRPQQYPVVERRFPLLVPSHLAPLDRRVPSDGVEERDSS